MITINAQNKSQLSEEQKEEASGIFQNMILKCWQDEKYQSMLIDSPLSVFKEEGIDLNGYKDIKIQQGSNLSERSEDDSTFVFNIPESPDQDTLEEIDISEEDLEKAAGGDVTVGSVALYLSIVVGSVTLYDFFFGDDPSPTYNTYNTRGNTYNTYDTGGNTGGGSSGGGGASGSFGSM